MSKLLKVFIAALVLTLLLAASSPAAPPSTTVTVPSYSPPQITIKNIWVIQTWTVNGQPVIVQESVLPVTTQPSCSGPGCYGPAICGARGQCSSCPTCVTVPISIPQPVYSVPYRTPPVLYNNCPNGVCPQTPANISRPTFLLPGKK